MGTLSGGRTLLRRSHENVGVLVHQCKDQGHFVHLQVFPVYDMDVTTMGQGFPDVENEKEITFRIVVGHGSAAIISRFFDLTTPKVIATNLWVDSGQEVWVSTNRPNRSLVHGTTSLTPVPF